MFSNVNKSGVLVAFLVWVLLSSCAGQKIVPENITLHQPGPIPQEKDYVLGYGDVIKVDFYYNPSLSRQATIRPDGKITLPLKGEVVAAGLTPAQFQESVVSLFRDLLKDPVVTVSVESFNKNNFVYVMGEVLRPDYYLLEAPTTVTQLLARAGVSTNSANLESVLVVSRTEEGKPVGKLVNVKKVLAEGDLNNDLLLKRYDIVYVSKTGIAKANLFVEQYINRIVPDFFRVSYNLERALDDSD